MDFPLDYARSSFPALKAAGTVYFDSARAPRPLCGLEGDGDGSGTDAGALLQATRESLAFFLNSNVDWAEEEIFITSEPRELAKRLAAALAASLDAGSKVIATELDEETSLAPWLALENQGIEVELWPPKRPSTGLDTERLRRRLSDRTRLVVMTKASGAVGTIVELLPMALGVQEHGGSLVVDWSSFLPHGAIDVRFLRADFVIASSRMFFGARAGFLWGKRERMRALRAEAPGVFEGLAASPAGLHRLGVVLRYVEQLGVVTQEMQLQPSEDYGRRRHMRRGMQAIRQYERLLSALFLRRLAEVPGATVYGINDEVAAAGRIPHFMFRLEGTTPAQVVESLAARGIEVGHGNGDSPRLMRALGLPEEEGAVRASLLHYNSTEEIENFAEALHGVAHGL